MTKRIKVADLPEFDAAAYLTDILEADNQALLAATVIDSVHACRMIEKN